MDKIKIVVIGTGNVALHMCKAFLQVKQSVEMVQCVGRNQKTLLEISQKLEIETTNDWRKIKPADIYIVSVVDDAIEEVALELSKNIDSDAIVAHTSGSVPLDILKHKNSAVFYPLQTFNKDVEVDWNKITIFYEANNQYAENKIVKAIDALDSKKYYATSKERLRLHIAAVFVSNFPVYLYSLAQKISGYNENITQALMPLLEQTTKKIVNSDCSEDFMSLLTGPAKRGDITIINKHINELSYSRDIQNIYEMLSGSIMENNEK